ncbi:hypothetical protein E4U42_003170 [Claviceps africana]|uniref:Pheromone n=1 Tax=Claviceps africana TaxID=83212 RepID=A0A8K0J8E6_9HYPO|nr:hypothetical protein E4U42_003170 [Claviceps africana]
MHVTSFLVALAAVGAHAAPSPEPEPWCWRIGEPCWKVKRVTEALTEAIRSSGGLTERAPEAEYSNAPGGAAYKARRSVNELAHLAALTTRNPDEYVRGLGLDEQFGAEARGVEKREPDPWCFRIGEPCWKSKRAAEAVLNEIRSDDAKDEAEADDAQHAAPPPATPFPPECNGPRILCWKKREASPEPEPEPWCWRIGEPCWKAKRHLKALELAARSIIDES